MADESEVNDKLVELLEYLRGDSGLKKSSKSKKEALDKSVTKAAESLKLLHGSTGDAAFALRKFGHTLSTALGLGSIGVIVNGLISSFTDMTRTFNKMSDVGQTFGGSMFEMQKQAGASGVSLEEFARQLEKGSTLASLMSDKQSQAGLSLGQFQKGVRDNLKQFGYYGMSLGQVNDAALELAESQRLSGHLGKLDSISERRSISDTIKVVSQFSAAMGKSREEILKLTNQALRNPGSAFRLATLSGEAQQAFTKFIAGVSAFPKEAGEELAQGMSETIEMGNSAFTDMGKVFREAGLSDINAMMDQEAEMIRSGQYDPQEVLALGRRIQQAVARSSSTLLELNKVPEMRPGIQKIMKIANAFRGMPSDDVILKKMQEADKPLDAITQQAMMFETNFQEFTGAFRDGLWGGLAKMMPKATDEAGMQKNLDAIKDNVSQFAEVIGVFAGEILLKGLPVFKGIISGITLGLKGIHKFYSFFLNNDWAGFATILSVIAGFYTLKKTLANFFSPREARIDAAIAKIYSGNVSGGGGADVSFDEGRTRRKGIRGAIGRFADRVKGGMGRMLRAGKSITHPRTLGSSLMSGVKTLGSGVLGAMKGSMGGVGKVLKVAGSGLLGGFKFLGRGIIGAVVGLAVDALLNMLPSFKGKETIQSMARYAGFGSTIGALLGFGIGSPVTGMVGAIVGLVLGAVVANFEDVANSAESLWRGTKGALSSAWKFVTGIAQAIWDGVWNLMPGAVKRLFGSSDAPLTPEQRDKAINAPVTSDEGAQELNQRLRVVADQLAVDRNLPSDPALTEEITRLLKKQNDLLEAQTALQAKNNDLQKRTSLFGGLPYAPGL